MASACVNNPTLPLPPSPFIGCFSPGFSFFGSDPNPNADHHHHHHPNDDDGGGGGFIDFEFHHLHDHHQPAVSADELYSGGKLLPLILLKPNNPDPITIPPPPNAAEPPPTPTPVIGSGSSDPYHFAVSPKAPTCSSRWRELLHLKRQLQHHHSKPDPNPKPKSASSSSLKHFLNRSFRSSSDPNLTLPLLKGSEPEPEPPPTSSSRHSISSATSSTSSSSRHEPEELHRLSLDSDNRPNRAPILLNRRVPVRAGRSPARATAQPPPRCASVDSPRMIATGRVVFQGLGRSSSSPSSFGGGGGPRVKPNVRVTPVLNVPVCKSFGLLFSGSGSNAKNVTSSSTKGKNY